MADDNRNNLGLLILAGVGAGALAGVLIGVVLGRRAGRETHDEISETVDDLKERAQQVLGELSGNVAELLQESRAKVEQAVQAGRGAAVHGGEES